MHIRSFAGHVVGMTFQALILAAIVAALAFGAVLVTGSPAGGSDVLAARGGKASGSGGSLTLAMVDPADTVANHGDRITFNVTTTNDRPVVSLSCTQNGNVVYGDSRPMYTPNIWDDPGIFTLSSVAWAGGAADCDAVLKGTRNGRVVTLGSTSFHVEA